MNLAIVFLIVALVLFALATFNVPARPNLTAAGLFFVTLAALFGRIALTLFVVLALSGCATSTAGLSKDQITEQQRQRAAWADFGRGVLTIAVNAGVASFANGPSTDGFRK